MCECSDKTGAMSYGESVDVGDCARAVGMEKGQLGVGTGNDQVSTVCMQGLTSNTHQHAEGDAPKFDLVSVCDGSGPISSSTGHAQSLAHLLLTRLLRVGKSEKGLKKTTCTRGTSCMSSSKTFSLQPI
jgi:hypothetical protein